MPSPGAGTNAALQRGAQQLLLLSLSRHEAAWELFGCCPPCTMLSLTPLGAGAGGCSHAHPRRAPTFKAGVRAGREARPPPGPALSTAQLFSVRKSKAPYYFFERTRGRKGERKRAGQPGWPRCCSFPPLYYFFFRLSRSTSVHPPLTGSESTKAAALPARGWGHSAGRGDRGRQTG